MDNCFKDDEFIVFDVETTGLNCEIDRICEIAAVKIKRLVIVDKFSSLVNPQRDIPDHVSKIHKITNQDVSNSPVFADVWPEFNRFLGRAPLLAYNGGFDLGFLDKQLQLDNLSLNNPVLDILLMAKFSFKQLSRYRLIDVCRFLDIEVQCFHRALADAEAAAEVFLKMIVYFKNNDIDNFEKLYSMFKIR